MIKIIINPQSRRGTHSWRSILDRLSGLGLSYEFVLTDRKKQAGLLAYQAYQEGFRDIFVMGGDGTLNEIVNGLPESEACFGVVPIGSGNDFAKMLGIRTVEQGMSSFNSQRKTFVDLGLANERYFINNVGIGLDAYVVYLKGELPRNRGEITYLTPALRAVLSCDAFEAEVRSDKLSYSGKVLSISVGNGRSHGGIFCLTPQAAIDDGLLDVCIIKDTARLKRFLNLFRVIKGRHLCLKEVISFKTGSLSIRSERPLLVHTDGELFEESVNSLEIKIFPRRLQFYLPKK